jgi:Uri superfamily endonuclease
MKYVTSVAEVRTAVEFVQAVNKIATVVGRSAKKLLLSADNPLLTPVLIGNLARRSSHSIQVAMDKAAAGLHPQARPVLKGMPSELGMWDFDLFRLEHATRLLGTEESRRPVQALSTANSTVVHRDAIAVRVASAALLLGLKHFGSSWRPPQTKQMASVPTLPHPREVKQARGLIEAVTHDLPLVLSQRAACPEAVNQLRTATEKLHAMASRLVARTQLDDVAGPKRLGPPLVDRPDGPDVLPGTYVMILHAEQSIVLRIGRLGTFWLPAGYWLYVGSAFGAGGVKARTDRHRDPTVPKMWNLDHLKAVARPVELWWTHETRKMECPWAMSLAELPGYRCPVARCGGNDCKSCPAHFYQTLEEPAAEAFVKMVRHAFPNHGAIYRQRLE